MTESMGGGDRLSGLPGVRVTHTLVRRSPTGVVVFGEAGRAFGR